MSLAWVGQMKVYHSFFFVAHILVPYQRTLAVGAVDQPLEDVFGGFQMREPAEIVKVFCLFALGKFLNLVKGFPIDQRLVGIFHDDPVLSGLHVLAPVFVEGLPLCALHHMPNVDLPGQNVFDRLNVPDHTVVFFLFVYTNLQIHLPDTFFALHQRCDTQQIAILIDVSRIGCCRRVIRVRFVAKIGRNRRHLTAVFR